MTKRVAVALAWACAWGCAPQPPPAQPGSGSGVGTGVGSGLGSGTGIGLGSGPGLGSVPDAGVTQEESLAAIQKAMNDLAPVAQQCWAKAATERFDIEGDIAATVTVDQPVQVELAVRGVPTIAPCMKSVLERYGWAPPLRGQTFRLPFSFKAPDGQSVIDRQLVDTHVQGNVGVRVLLDENNTGNANASMFELEIAQGDTGFRKTERAELWYFLDPAEVAIIGIPKLQWEPVAAGDMLFVPASGVREVRGTTRAVVVGVPGGREGAARAGALPARELQTGVRKQVFSPQRLLHAADAKTFGPATIYLDTTVIPNTPLAAELLQLPAGAHVAEHVHAHETELLYVLAGAGTMTVAGTQIAITPTSVVQIPPNTPHSFVATDAVRALQVYTPPGPEQRFKAPPKP